MCGIAGIIDPTTPPDHELLERMAQPLRKRGPDDFGYFLQNSVGLVHTRLSIIDIEGGRQPIFNEDNSLAITFNGEIYDFKNLREQLIAKGHRFRTVTDTEVLLHLYEDYGPELLRLVNGMFAFAICHVASGKLFMARDRFGQKPLFYAQSNGRFAFASGPSSLKQLSWIDTSIDTLAVHDYLEYQYVPTPRCIYRGMHKLPPGHFALWNDNQLSITPYWIPTITSDYNQGYKTAQSELKTKLTEAVHKRLVADVSVGLFLSGGMDSSVICALAQRQSGSPALSFSIGFPEKKYDERGYADLVARHIGTKHHFLEVIPNDFEQFFQIVYDYEEPFCDASMLPSTLLARFTRQHVKVALSGDGADELFGGYYRYRVMDLCRFLKYCPKFVRSNVCKTILGLVPRPKEERTFLGHVQRLLKLCDVEELDRYLKLISRFPHELKLRIYGERMKDDYPLRNSVKFLQDCHPKRITQCVADRIMEIDLRSYLCDDILTKVDRASMAHGLEVRSPFLDVAVAEMAMTLPYHWKQQGRLRKRILTDTFSNTLPSAIFTRAKMGFGVPIARWLRQEWYSHAASLLIDGHLVNNRYIQKWEMTRLLETHRAGNADYSYAIFALMVLEIWFQHQ